jgi:hypothetical protein
MLKDRSKYGGVFSIFDDFALGRHVPVASALARLAISCLESVPGGAVVL